MLVMTTKGLSKKELIEISDIAEDDWNCFRAVFNAFIIEFDNHFLIMNK